jgi:hypothetical protein
VSLQAALALIGATLLGALGWWIGDQVGLITAFILSTIATGIGLYLGRRIARDYLS